LLEQRGRDPEEVARLLNDRLRGCTVYCDGWAHDYTWLAMLFDEAGLRPAFTLRHLRELIGEEDAPRWDHTCAEVRAHLQLTRHRASSDARVLQLALRQLHQPVATAPRPAS
jgi:hypothetical protein